MHAPATVSGVQLPEIHSEYERIRLTWAHVMRQRQDSYPEYLRSLADSAQSQGDSPLALACRDLATRLSCSNLDRSAGGRAGGDGPPIHHA